MSAILEEVPLPPGLRLPGGPVLPILPPEALAHPARADGEPREMAARRVRVVLSGAGGVERVEGDGVALARSLGMPGATAANLVLGPRSARRECFLAGGSVLESVQLPEALPGAVFQWAHPRQDLGSARPFRLALELLPLHPEGGDAAEPRGVTTPIQVHRAPGVLWVSRRGRGVLLCAPGVDTMAEIELAEGHIRAIWEIPSGGLQEPATLLLQSAPPGGIWTSLTALARTSAHHRRGEAAAWGDGEPGIVLLSGVAELDLGVRWARSWIRDRVLSVPGAPPRVHPLHPPPADGHLLLGGGGSSPDEAWVPRGSGLAWLAMGAAASGDWEVGRAALDGLPWDTPRLSLLAALALAQWVAWTGEGRPMERALPQLLELFGEEEQEWLVSGDVSAGTRMEIAAAVASSAEAAGFTELVDAVKRAGNAAIGSSADGVTSRKLPMTGTSPWTAPPVLLRTGRDSLGPSQRLSEALAVRETLGLIARSPHLTDRSGAGSLALHALAAGVLGAVPDATFGRLTLSPFLPPHWTTATVRGIRTGEGMLELGYQRSGTSVRWTLEPREGSVPLMVVFEPWQPVTGIRSLKVDGGHAELDVTEEAGWSRVRLQLPADGLRVVEVEGRALSPPG